MAGKVKGLLDRLRDKEPVVVAEGYLFEFERRGYLQAGCFVPEVVLEHPDLVKQMYEEFVHAGSDVVEAFTYYAHREKLKLINREHDLEKIQRTALQLARQVANETGTLMAGNISNTTVYDTSSEAKAEVTHMFKEQIEWAVEEGADFIVAETYFSLGEAMLALEAIKAYGKGLPAVITFIASASGHTTEGIPFPQALRQLEVAGAEVVGLNCMTGPEVMLPLITEARKVCKGPLACVPVPYRSQGEEKNMADLTDPQTGEGVFPDQMDQFLIPRSVIGPFTKALRELDILYMGVCCGNRAYYIRSMAEALGRKPPASKYSTDMSKHFSTFKGGKNQHETAAWKANISTHQSKSGLK